MVSALSNIHEYLWLILAFPLAGVVLNGIIALVAERPLLLPADGHGHDDHGGHGDAHGGHHETPAYRKLVAFIAPGMIFAAFVVAVLSVLQLTRMPAEARTVVQTLFPWIQAGGLSVSVALQLDPLSSVMILVVTGVGFLIHVYSVGYMSHEPAFARFFFYLNLFMFSMLTLVLGSSYLLMFVGWEGVGLCSYLLIGFWYEKDSASTAGKKAFVVNRVGDFGFLLAMFLVFWNFGTLNYTDVMAKIPSLQHSGILTTGLATAITLLMFVGATGKSAQIPLYVWLPDAMEGPTPVSALIHAATMVTAGVYMVARSNALFMLAPFTMGTVAVIGAATAIFAASMGICQKDIKRVLAYSTVSQLGYMFLACGVGAFGAGIFHLMTHAFFKALLFLGSGSVIHAMSGEQDMMKMGSLRKHTPITFWTMFIGTLAIAGIPGLAGFFSKDEILWRAFSSDHGSPFLWAVAAVAAGTTAFYMFRLIFLTFFGASRMDKEVEKHVHESPFSMTIPLMVLAALSICGGWLGIPAALGGSNYFEKWLEPIFEGGHKAAEAATEAIGHGAMAHHDPMEFILMGASVAVALFGIAIAYYLYMVRPEKPAKIAEGNPNLYRLVYNKYFVDELYEWLIIRRIVDWSIWLWQMFDVQFIDAIVNGVAKTVRSAGDETRKIQTGVVGNYAFSILLGAVFIVGYLIWR